MVGLVVAMVAVVVAVVVGLDAGKKLAVEEHEVHGPLAHEGVVWAGMGGHK